jgi:hypothetical protein
MIETNNIHYFKLTFNILKGLLNKVSLIVSLVLIFWFFITYFFAHLFFEKKEKFTFSGRTYEIYYNERIDLKKLNSLIRTCDLHTLKIPDSRKENSKLKFRLFFCNNQNLYTFFAFMNRKGYATTSPLRNDTFISDINLEQGYAYTFPRDGKLKNDILITHEITHIFLNNLNINPKQKWIEEGYCEYVGYGSKIDIKEMLKKSSQSKYVRYVLGVDYLLKKNGNNIKKLENIDLTNEEVLEMLKKETSQ